MSNGLGDELWEKEGCIETVSLILFYFALLPTLLQVLLFIQIGDFFI
jgi:hypothetical protein